MNEQQSDEIRFFDAVSRIGRLRYFAYGMGLFLMVLPALILAAILLAFKMFVLAGVVFVLCYLFMIIMGVVFGVRRLHDLGWSGWWMIITPGSALCTIVNYFGVFPASLAWLPLLISLGSLVFYLILLFMPGSQGDNRFGPPPPPNSTWVIVGAWSFLIVPFFGGILAAIAIPAYRDYIARSQTAEGIQLAGGAEVAVVEYFQANKTWPTQLSAVYATAGQDPAGKFVATVTGSGSGNTYGVTSIMKGTGVNRWIAGKSVEIWTTDGGDTWHCGPGSTDPVEPKYLPASCRDTDAP
jgi:uncharacterized membrane protein YhaH (DUF805 family)/type II secretory pathway pseudopilin PulG